MNYSKLLENIVQQTGQEESVCREIINAYEKYCEEELKIPFKNEISEDVIVWCIEYTGFSKEIVAEVLSSLLLVVRDEIKRKIPFVKK